MASSRWYKRRIGRDSLNLPRSGKGTSTSPAPTFCGFWAGMPDQHRQNNRLYRRIQIGAAQRELSRNDGERSLAPGYACVTRSDWLRRYHNTVLPKGAHFWYKRNDEFWWLGKISASATEDKIYLFRFLNDPGPI